MDSNRTAQDGLRVPFVDLRLENEPLARELEPEILTLVSQSAFVLSEAVERFEQQFAAYLGATHCIGVGNGTDALLLALRALGLRPGDEVLLPANTFVATAEAVCHAGARPVFVDVDASSYTLDPGHVESRITSRTRAIILVHLYGQPADVDPIVTLARDRGLFVVEDAAQAHGAVYRGRRVGTLGDAGCFSFYPAKNLGAWGDAGAVVTNSDEVAERVRKLRNHGGTAKYEHELVGYNSRLDGIQALVLAAKLRHLDSWNQERRRAAELYDALLTDVPGVILPRVGPHRTHVYHLYVVRVPGDLRDVLRKHLQARGISTGVHYPQPLHETPALRQYAAGPLPTSERCAREVLSLPIHPGIEPDAIRYCASSIRDFMEHAYQRDRSAETRL